MNHSGDDRDDMDTDGQQQELDDRTVDRLLSGQLAGPGDLREIVELIRLAGAVPTPAPNPALAEVLRIGLHPASAPERQTPHVGWPMRTGLIAAALFAATFGAATANALPAPVQAFVDDIKARSPFGLPSPADRQQDVPPTSSPSPSQVPEPAAVPAPPTQRQQEGTVLLPLSGRSEEAPDARADDDDDAAVPERRDDSSHEQGAPSEQVTEERDEATDDAEAGTEPENSPPATDEDVEDVEDVEGAAEVDQDDPTELAERVSDAED